MARVALIECGSDYHDGLLKLIKRTLDRVDIESDLLERLSDISEHEIVVFSTNKLTQEAKILKKEKPNLMVLLFTSNIGENLDYEGVIPIIKNAPDGAFQLVRRINEFLQQKIVP